MRCNLACVYFSCLYPQVRKCSNNVSRSSTIIRAKCGGRGPVPPNDCNSLNSRDFNDFFIPPDFIAQVASSKELQRSLLKKRTPNNNKIKKRTRNEPKRPKVRLVPVFHPRCRFRFDPPRISATIAAPNGSPSNNHSNVARCAARKIRAGGLAKKELGS